MSYVFTLGLAAFPCRTSDPQCNFSLGLLDTVGRTSGQRTSGQEDYLAGGLVGRRSTGR